MDSAVRQEEVGLRLHGAFTPRRDEPSRCEWITQTPFGSLRHAVQVWTAREWERLPRASRPLDAVRLRNGCYVRMSDA